MFDFILKVSLPSFLYYHFDTFYYYYLLTILCRNIAETVIYFQK